MLEQLVEQLFQRPRYFPSSKKTWAQSIFGISRTAMIPNTNKQLPRTVYVLVSFMEIFRCSQKEIRRYFQRVA